MAKTRAQRKADRRKREAQAQRAAGRDRTDDARAQHRTQVPESADVVEAELAESGADLEALKETEPPAAPAPSRADVGAPDEAAKPSRRDRRTAERERKRRVRESEARRRPKEQPVERKRGAVSGFIASCWAELRRVQWPNRETLIQASAVTLLFITVAAAYLGALDAVFSEIVELIL